MGFTKENKRQEGELSHIPQYDLSNVIGGLEWYKNQNHRLLRFILLLVGTLFISATMNIILFLNKPEPVYFAATNDLRLAPLVPLSKPFITEAGLLNYVSEVVTNAISLDFLHWRKRLGATRHNFTDKAFKSFLASLQSSGIIDLIESKRLSLSAVISQSPIITGSGLVKGVVTWKIEFPLVLSYESSNGVESTQNLLAQVLVCRTNTAKTPRGVIIKQIILKKK